MIKLTILIAAHLKVKHVVAVSNGTVEDAACAFESGYSDD
jgi:hypothetical protein